MHYYFLFEYKMSSFTIAMDNHANSFVQGENGCLAHLTTSESLLDLFFKIVRGLTDIFSWVSKIIQEATLNNDPHLLANLFILTFQTRDIRGGKGERTLFYEMFLCTKTIQILVFYCCH